LNYLSATFNIILHSLILGETLKIVVVDYIQHLSMYNIKLVFDPEMLFGEGMQYQNRIALEFNHLYHWHTMMPDEFYVKNDTHSLGDVLYRADIVTKYGISDFVDALSKQRAGSVSFVKVPQRFQFVMVHLNQTGIRPKFLLCADYSPS